MAGDEPEAPVTSYRLLPPSPTAVIVAALVVLAAGGWLYTVRQADSMSDMATGLGQVGHRMPDTMSVAVFAVMWVAMMAAMMCPTLGPVVLAHRALAQRRQEATGSTVAFVAGYLGLWWVVGIVYLIPYLWFRHLPASAADSRWLPVLAGATLVAAGAYQFSRRKTHCQESCASPQAFVADHDPGPGAAGAFRLGVSNGMHCLGCCAALMAVLLVVGLMNLAWMLALSLVFVAEKHWRRTLGFGRVVGALLIVIGLAVAIWPDVLPRISGTSPTSKPPSNMKNMKM